MNECPILAICIRDVEDIVEKRSPRIIISFLQFVKSYIHICIIVH